MQNRNLYSFFFRNQCLKKFIKKKLWLYSSNAYEFFSIPYWAQIYGFNWSCFIKLNTIIWKSQKGAWLDGQFLKLYSLIIVQYQVTNRKKLMDCLFYLQLHISWLKPTANINFFFGIKHLFKEPPETKSLL